MPLKRYAWNICLNTAKLLTSCVPDGTPAPVGFYPTEALSLTGQETDNATQTLCLEYLSRYCKTVD